MIILDGMDVKDGLSVYDLYTSSVELYVFAFFNGRFNDFSVASHYTSSGQLYLSNGPLDGFAKQAKSASTSKENHEKSAYIPKRPKQKQLPYFSCVREPEWRS
jgi:hypothetical protein